MTMFDGTFSLANDGIVRLTTLETTIPLDVIRYMGEWIAISGEDVVAHGPHLDELVEETEAIEGPVEFQYISHMMLYAGRL